MRKKYLFALCLFMILAVLPQLTLAGTQVIAGVTIVTPDTHSDCTNVPFGETISVTGVAGRQLKGQIFATFVNADGSRVLPPFFSVNIDQTTDLSQFVPYPPVSQWPVKSTGGVEIHIDIQLELFDSNGFLIATIGPNSDWDVFCNNPPPPPPPPPPTGTQGCTPGYWKQDQHFDSWPAPYLPSTSFSSVFGRTVSGAPTLLAALQLNGGGVFALARHAAAALLSSGTVNYPYSTAQVISMFQAAYDSGDYEPTKNLFDAANNLGCPLS